MNSHAHDALVEQAKAKPRLTPLALIGVISLFALVFFAYLVGVQALYSNVIGPITLPQAFALVVLVTSLQLVPLLLVRVFRR